MAISTFKKLIVWQKSMQLTRAVYGICEKLPRYEQFALADQLRRSAVSVPVNISEGQRRRTRPDYAHFLRQAYGSAAELETLLILVEDLHSVSVRDAIALDVEIQKMLFVLTRKLENDS